jgi:hypothetical protein
VRGLGIYSYNQANLTSTVIGLWSLLAILGLSLKMYSTDILMSLYKALSQKSPGKFLTIIDVEWNKKI